MSMYRAGLAAAAQESVDTAEGGSNGIKSNDSNSPLGTTSRTVPETVLDVALFETTANNSFGRSHGEMRREESMGGRERIISGGMEAGGEETGVRKAVPRRTGREGPCDGDAEGDGRYDARLVRWSESLDFDG